MDEFNNSLFQRKLRNCKKCGELFSTNLYYMICPSCMQKEERIFDSLQAYLKEHPAATMEEVTENCDISEEDFFKLLRGEKIILSNQSPISYPCAACTAQIRRGNFCLSCKLVLKRRTLR